MAIKRYTANADTTITNAFGYDLTTRATGSNMGASDILEIYSIYGQSVSGSAQAKTTELSRVLVNFPVADIATDRTSGDIPASGSVNFYLRLFNAEHGSSVPSNFTLSASAVKADWEEGFGLDMEGYRDKTKDGTGASWTNAKSGSTWTKSGGDYHFDVTSSFDQTFTKGTEDLEMDVTTLVEQWISSSANDPAAVNLGDKSSARYGFGIFLSGTQEGKYTGTETNGRVQNLTGSTRSYYTKRFFARGSEFFFKRPVLEARWDSSEKDNRANFLLSSSLATAADNLNTIYLYNYVRGQLKNIPDASSGVVYVSVYSGSAANTAPNSEKLRLSISAPSVNDETTDSTLYYVTGGVIATGIYTASFAFTGASAAYEDASGSITKIYDVWSNADQTVEYFTGSISTQKLISSDNNPSDNYVTSMPNLKAIYSNSETARLRPFVRKKDWNPTIYSKATATVEAENIEDAYYKLIRVEDDLTVVEYGTGSLNHTRMSYDISGSYFDFDMSMLKADHMYAFKYVYYLNGNYVEQPEVFRFRVEKDLTDVE